ncbi:hypothetical protein LWI28_011054 [Acer negundo]|uniref:Reverse transcriptase Ty1/copia-type domain-containing protein n=1 Tax=Acer negundo TaxID=4023 RepID=A0AAD5NHL2_ACENE|nr:hypothetical protein LWI28_011054 [Acer negundo]
MSSSTNSRLNRSEFMNQEEPVLTKKQRKARSNLISKNLNFNLPIKLDQNNFVYWKAQILPIVRAFDLDEFLFGPVRRPQKYVETKDEETGETVKTINDDFLTWKKIDQLLVDDILITGSSSTLIKHTISQLHSTFVLKTFGSVNYFLGFEAYRNSTGLYLMQTKYIMDLLKKNSMLDSKPCSTPMSSGSKLTKLDGDSFDNPTAYRSTIGALQYLCCTRHDISYTGVFYLWQFSRARSSGSKVGKLFHKQCNNFNYGRKMN